MDILNFCSFHPHYSQFSLSFRNPTNIFFFHSPSLIKVDCMFISWGYLLKYGQPISGYITEENGTPSTSTHYLPIVPQWGWSLLISLLMYYTRWCPSLVPVTAAIVSSQMKCPVMSKRCYSAVLLPNFWLYSFHFFLWRIPELWSTW